MHSDGEQLKVWGLELEEDITSPYRNPGLRVPQKQKPRRSWSADKCINETGSCQFWVNHADSQQHAPESKSCSLEAYHRRDATNEIPCIILMRYERILIRNSWLEMKTSISRDILEPSPLGAGSSRWNVIFLSQLSDRAAPTFPYHCCQGFMDLVCMDKS